MSDRLLKIYHRLPAPARSLAASLRGLYLRSWRYGVESEELIAAASEREHWSTERWQRWQAEQLNYVLHRAATRVPYYRQYWAERRRRGDGASWEELQNWPVLSKETLRENPLAFIADDCDPKRMYQEHTSGTSGKPLDLWWSLKTIRSWYALFEARTRRWHGVSRDEPWGILGGQPVVPPETRRPPFWVWNAPMRQLYLSANHISRRSIPAYLEALERYSITHLITYSSSAALLARELARLGLRTGGIKTVITNAEPLFPWQREAIREGLSCEARETYGMAEIVAAASECPEGNLHLWPEVGWIEVLRDDDHHPVSPHEAGRLVCTGLLNADMPLIRYSVGDRLRTAPANSRCQCGRLLPLISGIEGRTNDMLMTRDGRYVYWLNPVFYGLPVCEAQIIQETTELIRVRYVPSHDFTATTEQTILDRLRTRIGDVGIVLEPVMEVPRGSNGKFQAVVCKLR
jgi:phenylacetate-CoA ligase